MANLLTMESKTQAQLTFADGCKDGFPILIGYFPTAMAFALVCRTMGMKFYQAVLFSVTNFAGSGQFLAANLIGGGALLIEIFISVLLVNLRYSFMGAELSRNLAPGIQGFSKALLAHGTTDEVFSVATLNRKPITKEYLSGLELTSYSGWVGGTAFGFIVSSALVPALQLAAGVTLYAMFSTLLAQEFRQKGILVLVIAGISALLNSILIILLKVAVGWSFVISMLLSSVIGALITAKEELN